MRRKLVKVCEDLVLNGQILKIKDLEGKWLTDEEGGGEGGNYIGSSVWVVYEDSETLENINQLEISGDQSYVSPLNPRPGTYYISNDDFSPVVNPFVGDDEEEYKENFVAKFKVTQDTVMKNRLAAFDTPLGIKNLRL